MNDTPSLFDQPVARSTDPATSHDAPSTVDRDAIQRAVLSIANVLGEFTHDEMVTAVNRRREIAGDTPLEPSTVRTRVKELVEQNLIADSGKTRTIHKPGKKRASKVIVWKITSLGFFKAPRDEERHAA